VPHSRRLVELAPEARRRLDRLIAKLDLMRRLAVALVVLSHFLALAQDWPEFRGPNRSGVSATKGLPSRFDTRTNVAWSVEAPAARSSPIISNKRLFLTAADAKNLTSLRQPQKTRRARSLTDQRAVQEIAVDALGEIAACANVARAPGCRLGPRIITASAAPPTASSP